MEVQDLSEIWAMIPRPARIDLLGIEPVSGLFRFLLRNSGDCDARELSFHLVSRLPSGAAEALQTAPLEAVRPPLKIKAGRDASISFPDQPPTPFTTNYISEPTRYLIASWDCPDIHGSRFTRTWRLAYGDAPTGFLFDEIVDLA